MDHDNVVRLRRPDDGAEDPLTEVLRDGARTLLAQAIEAEVAAWIATPCPSVDDAGRRQVVRNGHLPERTIQTGIGEVQVAAPGPRPRSGMPHGESRSPRPSCRPTCGGPEPGGADPLAVPQGHQHRRLHRGPRGDARAGRPRPVGHDRHPAQGGLGGRPRGVAGARWRASATSTSGPTACTSTSAWSRTASASWS